MRKHSWASFLFIKAMAKSNKKLFAIASKIDIAIIGRVITIEEEKIKKRTNTINIKERKLRVITSY